MFKLLLFTAFLYQCTCDPRSPRVYNVLITSKKNLAPSQAVPVYQPVIRTTSVGLAFTPFLFTPVAALDPTTYIHPGPAAEDILNLPKELQTQEEIQTSRNIQTQYVDRNLPSNVVPLQQYVPVYNPELTYEQYLPQDVSRKPPDVHQHLQPNKNRLPPLQSITSLDNQNVDPKRVIANLKTNPDIPDVPPPAIPVKTS